MEGPGSKQEGSELDSQGTAKVSWSRHHDHWKHTLDAASDHTEGILF